MLEAVSDQTRSLDAVYDKIQARSTVSLRSKRAQLRLRTDSSVLESTYDQIQVRSSLYALVVCPNLPLIRLKCARFRLWSDSSALDSLYALAVRSNPPKFKLKISLRLRHSGSRHSCARSRSWSNSSAIDSSHTLVVRSNPPMIRLKCARQPLSAPTIPGPDSIALEAVYDQTQ